MTCYLLGSDKNPTFQDYCAKQKSWVFRNVNGISDYVLIIKNPIL